MEEMKDRIIKLRKEMGWTQTDLAKLLNVAKSTVSMWEIGTRFPQRSALEDMSDLFNVDLDYLCMKTDIRKRVSFDNDGNTYINAPEYSPEIIEMVYLFGKLTEEQKNSILTLMRTFAQ